MKAWGVLALLGACSSETDGGTSYGSGVTITTASAGSTDESATADETTGTGTATDSGSGSTTTDSDTTASTSTTNTSDESSTGGGGGACSGSGDLSFDGAGGGAAANQNCPSTLFSVQVAGAPGPVADVDVELEAVAANTSENRLWLKSPLGTEVLLFDRRGNFLTDDFFGTMFDDQSGMPVAAAPGPFHACYSPEQALAAFNGQSADGTWTLRVETCLYETTVQSWALNLDF